MHVGLLTDGLGDWSLAEILSWLATTAPAVRTLEIATGGYSRAPHCDRVAMLADERRIRALVEAVTGNGLELAALNVSGNPLHPDPRIAADHDRALRETIELAVRLGVGRIVALSGCPGPPPGVPLPLCVIGARRPDLERILTWQWDECIVPYWHDLMAYARRVAPDVRICLEFSPSAAVYNVQTFERLSAAVAGLSVNLDPSHLFWQGADPLAVAERLNGRVGWAHGKDTVIQVEQCALNGVLDARWPDDPSERPWIFGVPGDDHNVDWWARFVRALEAGGYDGVISVEYEHPYRSATDGIAAAVTTLAAAIDAAAGR